MITVIKWPSTGHTAPGYMGFPSEYITYDADDYLCWVRPIVNGAIEKLESRIETLEKENNALKANKLKVKFNAKLGAWVVV